MESDRAPRTMFDTLLENCIFYISQLYEFSHRLGHSRHSCHLGVSGSPQERTFGQCPPLARGFAAAKAPTENFVAISKTRPPLRSEIDPRFLKIHSPHGKKNCSELLRFAGLRRLREECVRHSREQVLHVRSELPERVHWAVRRIA